jgi:hypothetical protein
MLIMVLILILLILAIGDWLGFDLLGFCFDRLLYVGIGLIYVFVRALVWIVLTISFFVVWSPMIALVLAAAYQGVPHVELFKY